VIEDGTELNLFDRQIQPPIAATLLHQVLLNRYNRTTTMLAIYVLFSLTPLTSAAAPPTVHANAAFAVHEQLGIPYAQGVLCAAVPCTAHDGESCQKPFGPILAAAPGCPHPQKFNLTLDLYTPLNVPASLGKRPAFIAHHSGGYKVNSERGFAPSYEMTAACKHFAARGYVALTMVYVACF
jgi:hypothetical protein